MGESVPNSDITGGHVKIGQASHTMRNLGLLAGAVVAAAGIYLFTAQTSSENAAAMSHFDAFRAAYASKCGVPSYAAAQPAGVNEGYLSSIPQQEAMVKELAALNGGSSCSDVAKALKSVDFTVPSAPSG